MKNAYFAAVLAVISATGPAQVPAAPINPAVDTAEERDTLRKLTICMADARPRWAKGMLAHPYLSDAQASVAAEAISGNDTCFRKSQAEITFRTSTMVGAIAEHFVRTGLPQADMDRVSAGLATVAPLNASEDFALCVAANNPAAALDLVRSEPGSGGEAAAASTLSKNITSCTKPGEHLDVDLQALRSLVAMALYRGMTRKSGSAG